MSYVMQVEQIDRQVLAVIAAVGPEMLEQVEKTREVFDQQLNSDPASTGNTTLDLLRREAGVTDAR